MNCEHCRHQLLPFLYDLLDPHERAATAAHLQSCLECQDALTIAREQQGMLAEAVKEEHPEIVFKAPSKNTPASTAPTVAFQRPPRRFSLLNRWAAAASILFLLLGAGSVVGWNVWRDQAAAYALSQQRLAKAKGDLSGAQNELREKKGQTQEDIRKVQEQIDKLFNVWKEEETKTRKVLEEKGAQLIIKGPQVAVAGANNNYEVEVRQELPGNLAQDASKDAEKGAKGGNKGDQKNVFAQQVAPLQVRALNQKTGKTVFEQQLKLQANNQASFVLPSNVANKPGEDIALQFQTSSLDGKLLTWTDNLKLVVPEYVTHLATDRPLYRPGETVRFRSLTLERFSLKPAQQKFHLRYRIVGPNNEEIYSKEFASTVIAGEGDGQKPTKGPQGEELDCLGGGEFTLPANLAAGQYILYVGEVNERFNEEKRTFRVHRWQPPRFTKELQFHRTSYGPGDQLKMQVRVVPVQPMPAGFRNNLQITIRVVVDGKKVMPDEVRQVDNEGRASFECNLPNQIHTGVGKVILECVDDGVRETLSRDIPLVVRDMQVEFYPEGGELIAAVPNRVYFQARTPANRPADFTGRIVDERDQEVARVHTVTDVQEPGINQGLGSFTFTPEIRKYKLRIDSPIGIERTIALPAVKADGVVLHLPQQVAENEIDVRVQSVGKKRDLLVGAYCRGRMLDTRSIQVGADQPMRLTLKPMAGVAGVYRITVFEKTGSGADLTFVPLAERLIYRKSAEKLDVAVTSDRPSYQPGEPVRLTLQARNEKRAFVPALALVVVVDTSLLKLADEKTARGLPTHFLLTTEVRNPEDLESADVLLTDHPKAAIALDLLLGAQGWRRFAEQDPLKFQRKQRQAQQPNFLANTDMVTQFLETEQKQIDKLDQGFVKEAIELEKKLAETEKQESGPAELVQVLDQKEASLQAIQQEVAQAEWRMRESRGLLIQFGLGGGLLVLLFVGFFMLSVGLRHLCEGTGNARAWLTAGVAWLGILFLISVIGTFALMGENLIDDFRNERFGQAAPFPKAPAPIDEPVNLPNQPRGIAEEERLVEDLQKAKEQLDDAKQRGVNPLAAEAVRAKVQVQPGLNRADLVEEQKDRVAHFQPNDLQEDRRLRQQGRYQALLLKNLGRRVELPPVHDPCVVREYAHRHKSAPGDPRGDFSETLCWQPVLVMPDGKAQVQFDLSDSITRFQVLVLSNTFDGRLGANRVEIASKLPFRMEPTVPEEVSDKDELTIPVALQNELAKPVVARWSARGMGLQIQGAAQNDLKLEVNEVRHVLLRAKPALGDGVATVRIVGQAGSARDAVERRIKIVQDGFPATGSIGGVLDNGLVEHEITLPEHWVLGSLQVQAHFYPSPLAELQGALNALAREPAGSFEQNVSSLYLNGLMLQYMKQHANQANPLLEKRARQSLRAIPREAFSIGGLWQLRELARIQPDDSNLLERTEQFLRGQLAKKDLGRVSDSVASAYVIWTLTETRMNDDLAEELAALRDRADTRKDPYFLALVGLSHLNRNKEQEGIALLRKLGEFQKDGRVTGARTSITGSQGRDLDVETTAFAILGWLKAERPGEFNPNVQSAVKWLGQQRQGAGSYGGTQATVLALKAVLAYQKNRREIQGGDVSMRVHIKNQFGGDMPDVVRPDRASISPRSQDPITLSVRNLDALRPGKNVMQLSVTGNNTVPYTLTWSFRTLKVANDPKAPIRLSTKLSQAEAKEGATVKLTAVVENVSGKKQGMTVAIVGLPAGLSVPEGAAQLKKMVMTGEIAAWEGRGRDLVLYWHDLAAAARIALELDVVCRLPGAYRGPASRAYLAYRSEDKFWTDNLNIRIISME